MNVSASVKPFGAGSSRGEGPPVADIDQAIGAAVKEARSALGISRLDMSAALGVSHQQLSKYESGQTPLKAAQIVKLAALLKVPINSFFSRVADPPSADRYRAVKIAAYETVKGLTPEQAAAFNTLLNS